MKETAKKIIAAFGFEIFKRDSRFHPEACMNHLCDRYGITQILDVGANTGQYARSLREWNCRKPILSFEPLSSAYEILVARTAADPNWRVAPRCAIGAERSVSKINIAGNSVSSSILDMTEIHTSTCPESSYCGQEEVRIETLDDMVSGMCADSDVFYLKIDTQGYEKQVLIGASATLVRTPVVQMELSIRPLYDGGFLFLEGIETMKNMGYRIFSVYQGFCDRKTGETLQADVIFVKDHA